MRSRFFAIAFTAATLSVPLSMTAYADNLRCGSRVVYSGDLREIVRKKCGEPVDISYQSIQRLPSYQRNGKTHYFGQEFIDVPVEVWTYNFGPNKFMRRLRFVDGLLEDIETLGYGYNQTN